MSAGGIAAAIIILIVGGGAYFAWQSGYLDSFLETYSERVSIPDIPLSGEPQSGSFVEEAGGEEFENSLTFELDGNEVEYPTLFPNPRWNHVPIRFYMDTSSGEGLTGFDSEDLEYVRTAAKVWEEKTGGVVSFVEVADPEEAELVISWSASLTQMTGGRVVGEGGPTRAIETGGKYTLLEGGEVFLIPTENRCVGVNRPVHEIGHVLGLGHAPAGFGDIMFSKEISCNQNITGVTVRAIEILYEEPALPDLTISEVSAVKRGGLLDINFTVRNVGLRDYVQASISFVGDGEEIESLSAPRFSVVPRILPGSGLTNRVTGARVPADLSEITLTVDAAGEIEEMREGNNAARVAFSAE